MRKLTVFFIITFIIALGAFLRFYKIYELATFKGDQAVELSGAYDILHGKFTLIGIKTSVSEMRNGAVMYYITAPFLYLFHYSPITGGIVQSLFSLATVVVVYLLGKKIGGYKTGFFAAFFIAFSPLLVRYSRQTLLAFYPLFFSAIALFLFVSVSENYTKIKVFLLGILLGFMLQVHYSSLSIIVSAIVFPYFFIKKQHRIQYFLYLFLGFDAGFLPMIVFELRHEFFQSKMLLSFIFGHKRRFIPFGFNFFSFFQTSSASLFFGDRNYLGGLFVASLLVLLVTCRNKLKTIEKLAYLQISGNLAFIFVFVREMIPHYAIISFVPMALLFSSLMDRLCSFVGAKRNMYCYLLLPALLLLLNFPSYGFGDNHGWTMTKFWNLPSVEKSAKLIKEDNPGKSFNVAMLIDNENQGLPIRYFLKIYGITPMSVDEYDKASVIYIVVEPGVDLYNTQFYEINAFGAFDIEKKWEVNPGIFLYKLVKKRINKVTLL